MKLKHKKNILLTTISSMGIGLLTLAISHDIPDTQESVSPKVSHATTLSATGDGSNNTSVEEADLEVNPSVTAPLPTPILDPEKLPVYEFEKKKNSKIEALMKDYYVAKNSCDVDKIKTLLSDPFKGMSLEQLQKATEFVEDYRNIECHVKKSFEEGCYIVYVYHEIKLNGIQTPAPALGSFYIITDTNGSLKIYSDDMDPVLKEYYSKSLENKDVIELINYTEDKVKKAKKKDETLLTFWEYLDKEKENNQQTTEAQGDAGN